MQSPSPPRSARPTCLVEDGGDCRRCSGRKGLTRASCHVPHTLVLYHALRVSALELVRAHAHLGPVWTMLVHVPCLAWSSGVEVAVIVQTKAKQWHMSTSGSRGRLPVVAMSARKYV